MTLPQFTQLLNAHRAQLTPPHHPLKFSLTKRKVVKKRVDKTVMSESGVPRLVTVEPVVTREVADTNGITKLYQEMFYYFLGTKLKRISSEGSWRPGVGFIPSSNKGIADLMGGYNGKVYYIEVKQAKERLLPSQIKFKEWVESFGGEYHVIHSFDEMLNLINKIKTII